MMREEAENEPTPILDDAVPTHLLKAEIANCATCDDDGYRPNGHVCDHVDHSGVNQRGMAKVRAVLGGKPAVTKVDEPYDLLAVIKRQRESGPPQPLSDPEPEL